MIPHDKMVDGGDLTTKQPFTSRGVESSTSRFRGQDRNQTRDEVEDFDDSTDCTSIKPGAFPSQSNSFVTSPAEYDSVQTPDLHSPPLLEATLVEDAAATTRQEQEHSLSATQILDAVPVDEIPKVVAWKDRRVQVGVLGLLLIVVAITTGLSLVLGGQSVEPIDPAAPTQTTVPAATLPTEPPTLLPLAYKRTVLNTSDASDCQDICTPNMALSHDGQFLLINPYNSTGTEFWTLQQNEVNEQEWVPSDLLPPLMLAEPINHHSQNLDILVQDITMEGSERKVVTVAVAYLHHIAVYQYPRRINGNTTQDTWVQLGADFVAYEAPPGYDGFPYVYLSLELAEREDTSVVMTVGIVDVASGESTMAVHQYDTPSNEWTIIGNETIAGWAFTEFPVVVRLAQHGKILAVSLMGFTGSGKVRVFSEEEHCNHQEDDGQSKYWCQLGDDINGGDYEDLFGSSMSISEDGNRIIVGAPGTYDCSTGEFCSVARVFSYASNANTPRWLQLGQHLDVYDVDGKNQRTGFGSQVEISNDGNTIAVSHSGFYSWPSEPPGLHVYTLVNGLWVHRLDYEWDTYDGPIEMQFSKTGDVVVGAQDPNIVVIYPGV